MTTIPSSIIAAAQAAAAKWHIPASITLAQWALESGWGKHASAPSNWFGMKALVGQPSVTVPTREVYHGHSVIVQAAFRAFANDAEAFDAHGKLLATAGVYAHARAALPDPFAFAAALVGTYATDPKYGALLGEIILDSNLTQYDTTAAPLILPTLQMGSQGDAVRQLQRGLGIAEDGVFGQATYAAVRAFQRGKGLTIDGIVGAATWKALG